MTAKRPLFDSNSIPSPALSYMVPPSPDDAGLLAFRELDDAFLDLTPIALRTMMASAKPLPAATSATT